jgi:hypothetical protein
MPTPNTTADKFVLLFSSDWFRPHWELTGFVPKDGESEAIQQEMRDLVTPMMDGAACYWDINFTDDRLAQTRADLLTSLIQHAAEESNLSLIRALVSGDDPADALTAVSMALWDNYDGSLEEIEQANLAATDWDRRLVALTPDLPSFVQNFILVTVLRGWP